MPPCWYDSELNADAAEFCPVPGYRSLVVAGTYQLEESDEGGRAEQQTRHGRLLLLETSGPDSSIVLEEKSRLDVPGVFDIKWSGGGAAAVLGHAAADGALYTYALTTGDDPRPVLERTGSIDCRTSADAVGALALSLDWDDRVTDSPDAAAAVRSRTAAVSMSDGTVCIVTMALDGSLTKTEQWQAHDLEAWIVGFDAHNHKVSETDGCRVNRGWLCATSPARAVPACSCPSATCRTSRCSSPPLRTRSCTVALTMRN